MDLEATWQEHKKFIVSVGIGALAFGLFASGIKGLEASAETSAKNNARAQTDLNKEIASLKGAEANEKGKKKALEEKAAPEVRKTVIWTVPPDFVPKADDALPGATYEKLRAAAVDDMGKRADKSGVMMQRTSEHRVELGLSGADGVTGPVLAEKFARVDLTTRIANAVLDAGVKKVDKIEQKEAGYSQLEGSEAEKPGFLRRLPCTVTFEGTISQLAKVLATFEVEGSFLEVEACDVRRSKEAKPDGTDGRLTVSLTLTALTIEKDAPADSVKDPGEDNPKKHHRRGDK
ncbi:hypothetical protein HY251_18145 [bacterium]|nr:hypothetical protein [bacterium]